MTHEQALMTAAMVSVAGSALNIPALTVLGFIWLVALIVGYKQ